MTCRHCGKVNPGKRQVCPVVCASRHREALRIDRRIERYYRASQRLRRAA